MAGSCCSAAAGNRSAVTAVGSSFSIRSLVVRCLQRILVAAVVAPPAMVDVVVLSF